MATTAFNPIRYATRLKKAASSDERADIEAEELSNLINDNLATKDDLKILKMEMQAFFVKALIGTGAAIGAMQTLFHFLKP